MTVVSMPILHRPAELAELLDCSLRHVYDLRLPSYHPTRRVTLIRADDAMHATGVPLDTYETIDGWPDVAAGELRTLARTLKLFLVKLVFRFRGGDVLLDSLSGRSHHRGEVFEGAAQVCGGVVRAVRA